MASAGIRRSRSLPAVVATVVAGVVAGCATVPSTNAPRQVLTGGNAVQAYVRPLPPPPPSSRLYKSAYETVLGFLSASATYAYDPAAARQFLSPAQRKTWRPGPVTVVTPLSEKPQPSSAQDLTCRARATCAQSRRGTSSAGVQYQSVKITAQHLATLSSGGQYEPSAGTSTYTFTLAKPKKGVWLITKLPSGVLNSLLLTKASFQEVYQPRNLFFWARQRTVVNGELVPEPVYAPLQSANNALNTDVAAGLVKGLLSEPSGWLSGAATTAFPPGTTLVHVMLRGQVAIVDLSGTAIKNASAPRRSQMKAQLLATLDSKAYSSPLAHNVVLEIDGQEPFANSLSNLVSPVSRGQLVYRSGPDTVSKIEGNGLSALAVPRQIGLEQITATAATDVGATLDGNVAVAVQNGGGCAVYVSTASGGPYHSLPIPGPTGPCTSLSWDRNGNLWAVAGGHIWLLHIWLVGSKTHYQWLTVSAPPNLPPDGKSGPSVVSMQMAPDGVRAALLVKASRGNQVLLAAVVVTAKPAKIVGTKIVPVEGSTLSVSLGPAVPAWRLSHPIALSWYNPYELAVLTRTGVWQVPLTGGAGRLLGNAPAGAMSLASNGAALAVGTSDHERYGLWESRNGGNSWQSVVSETFPTYPTYTTYQSSVPGLDAVFGPG